ncbi:MAG: hypothetical protein U0S12_04445 [Fimbriimonadales bacterium]
MGVVWVMNKALLLAAASVGVVALHSLQAGPITAPDLKALIEGMGYTTKALNEEKGKEKYEFTIKTEKFNVPIAAEVTPSTNYIWFTAFLGADKDDAVMHTALLKQNFKVQPTVFYVTDKGNLMAGVPVDNRGVTAAVIKRVTDKLAEDVSKTAEIWSK